MSETAKHTLGGLEKMIANCGRYDIVEVKGDWTSTNEMVLHPTGDYILWDDVRKCIAQAKAKDAALLETLETVHDWLSSFSMPPASTIQEKQEMMAIIEKAIAKAGAR